MTNDSLLRTTGANAGLVGLIMAAVGFGYDFQGVSSSAYYNSVVSATTFVMKWGGVSLLVAAGLCLAGLRAGMLIEGVASLLSGLVLAPSGAYQLFVDQSFNSMVYLIMGVVSLGSARRTLALWRVGSRPARPVAAAATEAPHPASVRPRGLPASDEPPPPDGYLAALGRAEKKPPVEGE